MTPHQTAQASADAISELSRHFFLDPATYQRGAELGYPGLDFYFVGRCGVLGRVPADVVCATVIFFPPDVVRAAWQAGLTVMDPRDAAAIFAACGHTWARRLPDTLDVERLADLAGRLVHAASCAGAPLFGGWRAMPEPSDPKALALHRMTVLRELRGSLHSLAVLASGLRPQDAVAFREPHMLAVFGWDAELAPSEGTGPRWEQAQALTDNLMAAAFEALDPSERAQFVALAEAARAAAAG